MFMDSLMDTLASFHRLMWIRLISGSKLAIGVNVVCLSVLHCDTLVPWVYHAFCPMTAGVWVDGL